MCKYGARLFLFFLLTFSISPDLVNAQPQELKFEHITSETGLPQNTIHGIVKDKFGFMWFGTWGGLCRYDGYSFKVYKNDPQNERSLNNNRVHNIIRDKRGDIWVLTFNAGELCRYNYESDDFDRILSAAVRPGFYALLERRKHHETVSFLYQDTRWHLDAYTNGLVQSDLKSGRSQKYFLNPANPWSLNDPYVTDIYKDDQNILWVGTYSNGINKANLEAKPFKYFYHDPSNPNSIVDNNVRAISEDKSGNLWIGTRDRGITIIGKNFYKHLRSEFGNNNSLNSDQIKKIFCDSRGIMWIGNKKGLDSYDPGKAAFRHWTDLDLANTTVFGITEDRRQNIWFASWKGIYKYNPSQDKLIHYDPQKTLKNNHARVIMIDWKQRVWVGTEGGGLSVLKYSPGTESVEVIKHFMHDARNPNTISDDRVNALFEDSKGFIWIGTGNGLDRLDPSNLKITHLPESSGLADVTVAGIEEDNHRFLWISHKKGISQLNCKTLAARNYTSQDGLQSNEFSDEAAYRSKFKNVLFFGGNNGFNAFNPDSIQTDHSLPRTVITQLQVLNHTVGINEEINDRVILTKPLHLLKELVLTYDDKSFSLEFAGLHYSNPNGNKYAYKLEGFDKEWISASSSRRIATYANLAPGSYKFMVKSSNSDGVWNDKPAVLKILVKPPFWASGYAYFLYLFLSLVLLYVYHYYSSRYTRLKSKLSYESLIREKERELHQHKLQFFTNISHEIKTPLTLILAPLEKLSGLYFDNSVVSEQFKNMKINGERLMKLINQLLDFRKLETGNVELDIQRNDLIAFVEHVIRPFHLVMADKGIRFTFKHEKPVYYQYYDEDKLEKVMANLLSNAMKFTPKNGFIEIRVSVESENDNEFTVLEVANSGDGIPADERDSIFKPFIQSAKNNAGGTGLGLAYSRDLVQLHGGTLSVNCYDLPDGSYETVFSIGLPFKTGSNNEFEQIIPPDTHEEEKSDKNGHSEWTGAPFSEKLLNPVIINGKVPLILLVEDNPDLRKYLKDHFQITYQIIEAENGLEALTLAAVHLPDLILSDVMMPEMDGIELCRRIKTNTKTAHIPVVLLTARSPLENQIEGLETGADDYIVKPFSLSYLTVKVKNILLSRNGLKDKYRKEISIQPTGNIPLSADEKLLNKVLKYIEDRIAEPELNIEGIASEVGLSRAQLYRRIKTITGLTVAEVIKEVKLKRAKQLLKDRKFNINEITYMTGFSDPDYFRKCFKAEFGVAPSKYYKSKQEQDNFRDDDE